MGIQSVAMGIPDPMPTGPVEMTLSCVRRSSYQNTTAFSLPSLQQSSNSRQLQHSICWSLSANLVVAGCQVQVKHETAFHRRQHTRILCMSMQLVIQC